MTDTSFPMAPPHGRPLALSVAIVALWGTGILALAAQGAFVEPAATPPVRLLLAVLVPLGIFLAAHALIPALRGWVAALDPGLVVGLQTWRVLGVVFLFVWALGQLPSVFALTAGLGDVAVGVLALGVTLSVARRAPGWQGRVRILTTVGILDFVLAFATATLSGAGRPLQFVGEPLPAMMQTLPMVMIPAFGVPLFLIGHAIALIALRRAAD